MASAPQGLGPNAPDGDVDPLWREVLGRRLRELRRSQGGTLTRTARRAGISTQYLSEVERGRKDASSEIIAAIAGALGLRIGEVAWMAAADLLTAAGLAAADLTAADPAVADLAAADLAAAGPAVAELTAASRPAADRAAAGRAAAGRAVGRRGAADAAWRGPADAAWRGQADAARLSVVRPIGTRLARGDLTHDDLTRTLGGGSNGCAATGPVALAGSLALAA